MDIAQLSKEDVRRAVGRLLADAGFRASKRNKKFLEFVVEETLEGRGERIKAYTIAVDVFGRSADFDPSLDPIVRIEAARLRTALRAYYEGPGMATGMQIMLPVGRYEPQFVPPPNRCADDFFAGEFGDRIKVLVEVDATVERLSDILDAAVDITIDSLRIRDLRVFFIPIQNRPSAISIVDRLLKDSGVTIVVSLTERAGAIRWRVSDLSTGEVVFSSKVQLDAKNVPRDLLAIAQQIARMILNIRAE